MLTSPPVQAFTIYTLQKTQQNCIINPAREPHKL